MKKQYKVGKRVVGTLDDGVFEKSVDFQKHHLHKYHAWAIDKYLLADLTKDNCKKIVIKDRTSGRIWEILFADFVAKGFKINHGFGEQIAVADINFTEKILKQMDFFEGAKCL